MAYLDKELSESDAYPVELYRFTSDAFSAPYLYTSADESIIYSSETYDPIYLKRSQPELTREVSAQQLELIVRRDLPLAKLWLQYVPPRTVWVSVFRYHRSEVSAPEVITFWQGKVRGVAWSGNEASIQCLPIDTAFSRNGLRVTYGATCRHQLYGLKCKVPLVNFIKTATITGISGNTIQSPDFVTVSDNVTPAPDGWWVAGFIENPVTSELRYITSHSNTSIDVLTAFETLQPGDTVNIAAGCNHIATTCDNKFGNIVNYGGLGLYIPEDNPFTIKLNE